MKKLMPLLCKPLEKIMSMKMDVAEGKATEDKLGPLVKA